MNWDAIGAIAELLGAVGVILTLAYLAFQIRQNTQQLANNARDARNAAMSSLAIGDHSWAMQMGMSRETSDLWFRGLADYESLDATERGQIQWLLTAQLNAFRQSYHLHLEGVLREDLWETHFAAVQWLVSQPGFLPWWERWGDLWLDEFADLIRDILAAERTHAALRGDAADSA
jgi:hypothetical protein